MISQNIVDSKSQKPTDNQDLHTSVQDTEHNRSKDDLLKIERDAEVEELRARIEVLEDRLIRAAAESENIRRRYDKMLLEAKEYAISSFAKDLLGVMDNLTRALEYEIDNKDPQILSVISGVDMTKKELESVFKKHDLELLCPNIGDKFDYNSHHAISQVVTDDSEHDIIMNVVQSGYKLKGRLLRPAMVVVSKRD
jgi:molecular chaperone GrpE